MAHIGRKIATIRINNGLTLGEFAREIFVSKQTLWNYENDITEPSAETVLDICAKFAIDVRYFESSVDVSRLEHYRVRNGECCADRFMPLGDVLLSSDIVLDDASVDKILHKIRKLTYLDNESTSTKKKVLGVTGIVALVVFVIFSVAIL